MSRFILSAFGDEIAPDLKTQMDVLESHGIGCIEIRNVDGRPIVHHSLREVGEIRKKLDERGFKISAVGSPIGKIFIKDDFSPHLDLFRHTLEAAKILEAPYIRLFSFYMPKGEDPGLYRDEVLKRFEEFIKAARGSGITLLHENEKGIYGDTPGRCLDLFNSLECDYLKATFDPANFVQCGVSTYPDAYEVLKKHIAYLHIKDAVLSDGHVVPAGYGDGKVKELLAALYRDGFKGFLSLEPHLGYFEGLASLELDLKVADMPEGGPRMFAVAALALKKLLEEIEKE